MSDNRRTCLYGHEVVGRYILCPECNTSILCDNIDRVAARWSLMRCAGLMEANSRTAKLAMNPTDTAEIVANLPAEVRKSFIHQTIHAFARGQLWIYSRERP